MAASTRPADEAQANWPQHQAQVGLRLFGLAVNAEKESKHIEDVKAFLSEESAKGGIYHVTIPNETWLDPAGPMPASGDELWMLRIPDPSKVVWKSPGRDQKGEERAQDQVRQNGGVVFVRRKHIMKVMATVKNAEPTFSDVRVFGSPEGKHVFQYVINNDTMVELLDVQAAQQVSNPTTRVQIRTPQGDIGFVSCKNLLGPVTADRPDPAAAAVVKNTFLHYQHEEPKGQHLQSMPARIGSPAAALSVSPVPAAPPGDPVHINLGGFTGMPPPPALAGAESAGGRPNVCVKRIKKSKKDAIGKQERIRQLEELARTLRVLDFRPLWESEEVQGPWCFVQLQPLHLHDLKATILASPGGREKFEPSKQPGDVSWKKDHVIVPYDQQRLLSDIAGVQWEEVWEGQFDLGHVYTAEQLQQHQQTELAKRGLTLVNGVVGVKKTPSDGALHSLPAPAREPWNGDVTDRS